MTLKALDNLVAIGKLKPEPPDQKEFNGMLHSARRSLQDVQVEGISEAGRFTFAYGAAHALALAAIRWHGYRSDHRYLVFQCLSYTVGFEDKKWRVLDAAHRQRNIAEYEGHLEIPGKLLEELITVAKELLVLVERLGPVN